MDQFVQIRGLFAENRRHFVRPLLLVKHVGVIEVRAHLMLKQQGELLVHQNFIGVITQALVPQQFDAPLYPAPAILRTRKLYRNIVRHVPGFVVPNLDVMRFKLRNPFSQLRHFEKLVLVLQISRAHP